MLGAGASVALVGATLTGIAVVEIATAPEASAASSNNYCGGVGTWNGSQCVFESQSNGSWTKPPWVGNYSVKLVGGGGGGTSVFSTTAPSDPQWGSPGKPGALEDIPSASTSPITFTIGAGGFGSPVYPTRATSGGPTSVPELARTAAGGTAPSEGMWWNCTTQNPATFTPTGWVAGRSAQAGPLSGKNWGTSGWGGISQNNGSCATNGGPTSPSGQDGQAGGIVITFSSAPTPSDPSGVSATANAVNATFSVSFTPSVNLGGLTATYDVTCTATGGVTVSGSGSVSPVITTSGPATRGASYTCSVQTLTLGGTSNAVATGAPVEMPGAPQNDTVPTIAGTAALKTPAQTLTGTPGTWNDFGFPIDDTQYQWQYANDAGFTSGVSNAPGDDSASLTYSITAPILAGKYLRLGVRTRNTYGLSDWAYSVSSAQVTSLPVFTAESPSTLSDVNSAYPGYSFAADGYRITYSIDSSGLTGLPTGMTLNPSSGVLSGTPMQVGTFTYRVKASNASGDDTTPVLTLTVSDGVPAQLVIQQQPVAGMPSRTPLTTQPIIQVRDDSGLLIYTPQNVTVSPNGPSAVLGGTLTQSTGNTGVATFTNLTLGGLVDTNYTLTFTSGAANVTSGNLQVTPGAAYDLRISTAPDAAAAAGAVMTTQPVIRIRDRDGNTTPDNSAVTLTPETGGFVGPTQSSVATATAVNGIATFAGVEFGGPVNVPKRLTFSSPGLVDDSANVVSTAVGAAYKLSVTTEANSPSNSGAAFTTVPQVTRQDMGGNTVDAAPQATVTASVAPTSQPYQVLVGPTSQSTISGVATFTGLGLSGTLGTTYTVTYSSPGLFPGDDTVVTAEGAAARLSLTSPGSGAVPPGDANYVDDTLVPQPRVQIVDSGNNRKSVSGVQVVASIVTGTGALTNVTATTDGNGLATFTNLRLTGVAGVFTLRFSATGYAAIDDTVVLSRAPQAVTLAPIGPKALGDPNFTISATTTSGLRTVFSSTTPSVCSVGGNRATVGATTGGAVSVLGAGTCTIVASQPGDAFWEPSVDDSESFTVSPGTQASLTIVAPTAAVAGTSVTLATRGGSGSGAVTYAETADTGGICALAGNVVTITGSGNSCQFEATKAADGNYGSATSAPFTITVGAGDKSPQTVAFTSTPPASPAVDDTYIASASATSGLAVTISRQSGPCTTTTGISPVTVTFTGAGVCVLEAAQAGDGAFAAASPTATQTVRIAQSARNQAITFAQPAAQRFGTPDYRVLATATSGLAVTFASTTSAVCTVTAGGIVHLASVGSCTLAATQAGDGTYSAADTVTRTFTVSPGLPSAPRIWSISASSGAATLTFAAPDDTGGAAIAAYTIVATPTPGSPGSPVSSSACTASPCTIRGLTDGTAYTVTIAAINVAGTGPASTASPQVTPRSDPLAVGNLRASTPTNGSVTLTWTAPTSLGGGVFQSYNVYYRATGAAWPLIPYDLVATTTSTVSGLASGVTYEFLVIVVTSTNPQETPPNASGPDAATVTATVPSAPTPPRNLSALYVTDTSIVVSWAYPASDGGSPVTAYPVVLTRGAICSTPNLDATSRTATCTVSGLVTGTAYTISVSATNAVGSSSAAVIGYTTPGNPPPTPPGPTPPGPTPPGPAPGPTPPPPVPPGGGVVEVDGEIVPSTLTPDPATGSIGIVGNDTALGGGDFTLSATGYSPAGERLPLGPDDGLSVPQLGQVDVSGSGYASSRAVSVYVLSPATRSRSVVSVLLGTTTTTATGGFTARFTLPASISPARYVLQINGYNDDDRVRSASISLEVTPTPWITITGKRDVGRVSVTGMSGEIPARSRVVPMIKFGASRDFERGKGVRVIGERGGFQWQRKVAKGRKIWVYFAVLPVKSNVVAMRALTGGREAD